MNTVNVMFTDTWWREGGQDDLGVVWLLGRRFTLPWALPILVHNHSCVHEHGCLHEHEDSWTQLCLWTHCVQAVFMPMHIVHCFHAELCPNPEHCIHSVHEPCIHQHSCSCPAKMLTMSLAILFFRQKNTQPHCSSKFNCFMNFLYATLRFVCLFVSYITQFTHLKR